MDSKHYLHTIAHALVMLTSELNVDMYRGDVCCPPIKSTTFPVFTLGSIYSNYASGAEQTTETNNSNQT